MFYLTKNQFFNYLRPIANIKFYCLKSVTIKDLLSYKSVLNTITRTNPSRSICGVHYMTRESIFLNQHGSQPTATNIFFSIIQQRATSKSVWWWWWWWWWWIIFVVSLTEERRLALFLSRTITRDPRHRESLTRCEEDLNLPRVWVQV